MNKGIHRAYIIFLIIVGTLSALIAGARGVGYYWTADKERPFHSDYELLKPTGTYGHGYGVIGSLMITLGVVLYSTRKRVRRFSRLGGINHYLEFHIFLCVTGPLLILFHTTFKFGGLVAVSFWSMTAVVLSGLIGRYFYVQIPKGIQGNELSAAELATEHQKLAEVLQSQYGISPAILQRLDAIARPPKPASGMTLAEVLQFFVLNDLTRRRKLRSAFAVPAEKQPGRALVKQLHRLANRRITLTRRIAFLEQFQQIFHYWHVIHLPFSIVMFVILLIHVGVAIAFGYTWIL